MIIFLVRIPPMQSAEDYDSYVLMNGTSRHTFDPLGVTLNVLEHPQDTSQFLSSLMLRPM